VLLEVVDASDRHGPEHRRTVQQVLDGLGAGDKPRLVVLNKVDLLDPVAANGDGPVPVIGGSVLASAQTGFGLDVVRAQLAALLADLWEEVDVTLPYSEGELLSRVRERGTVDISYRARDVRVKGRVAPQLAGELRAASTRWSRADTA
jgi:GTP-binding protein HflX